MKLQEGQGLSRSMVYDAIAHLAWRHGVVFHEEYMLFPEYDDETTRIFYRNISRIVTTRLYVGILQKNGYLFVFMRDSSRKIFIDLLYGYGRNGQILADCYTIKLQRHRVKRCTDLNIDL